MPTRVSSDRITKYKDDRRKMEEYMKGPSEFIPVDLNGARTDLRKGEDSLMKAAEDIKYRFNLDLPISRNDREGGEY